MVNPNDKFRQVNGGKVISVANLPDSFKIRELEEYRREMKELMVEMDICPKCHENEPCGCTE